LIYFQSFASLIAFITPQLALAADIFFAIRLPFSSIADEPQRSNEKIHIHYFIDYIDTFLSLSRLAKILTLLSASPLMRRH
jgi:hypothetical protein